MIFCYSAMNGLSINSFGRVRPCCVVTSMRTLTGTPGVTETYDLDWVNTYPHIMKETGWFGWKPKIQEAKHVQDLINDVLLCEMRNDLKNDIRPDICNRCFPVEDQGGTSFRQNYNIDHKDVADYDAVGEHGVIKDLKSITYLDLTLGNTCNLQCKTCNPWSSHNWLKEVQELPHQNFEKRRVNEDQPEGDRQQDDFDVVDESNLQRQVLFGMDQIGKPKLNAAKERLKKLNPYTQFELYEVALSSENALDIMKNYDIIVDGTDNFPTRYLVNDACVILNKPNVYGSIYRFDGQISIFNYKEGPCYRCLYPAPPPPNLVPSCAEGGVLGVLPGIIGTMQANEVIKLILGIGNPMKNRFLLFDALTFEFNELKIQKNEDCVACGNNPTIKKLIDYKQFCGIESANTKIEYSDVSVNELDKILKENSLGKKYHNYKS